MNTEYRSHNWLNIKTLRPMFGIQAKRGNRWLHCAEDGKALIFRSEKSRDKKLNALRSAQ